MRALATRAVVVLLALTALCACQVQQSADLDQRIAAEPQNWLSHGRDYAETRDSPLTQISVSNVDRLGLAWSYDLDTNRGQEATPIVVDGVVYTTSAWSKVQAFDGVSGRLLWQYDPQVPGETAARACCDVVNRGVAYSDGALFVGALDGRLIALDARTGKVRWSVQTVTLGDNNTITGAPRVVKGRVIIGNGGAELGARGYISAYEAASGKLSWRFYTVPGKPGTRDHAASDVPLARLAAKTWAGDWWSKKGGLGGGTAWDSMAYDPQLDLLYIGTGNASYWNRKIRSAGQGDNLFVSSILALRPETGEYVWHYQQVPGDEWDYTATQSIILADLNIGGTMRQVLMQAPKNGFYYILDRRTGKLISATPYAPQNWAYGINPVTARPDIRSEARYSEAGKPFIAMPGPSGAHNWHSMAWSRSTGLAYIPVQVAGGAYVPDETFRPNSVGVNVGVDPLSLAYPDDAQTRRAIIASLKGALVAWNPVTGKPAWRVDYPSLPNGGVLATAGQLIFQGDGEGFFNAYDAQTGKRLWRFEAQSAIMAAPVTWSRDGKQYVTVLSGWGGSLALMLGDGVKNARGQVRPNRSRVLTFVLEGKASLPVAVDAAPAGMPKLTAFGDASTILRGKILYHRTCFVCHGVNAVSGSTIPDLRFSEAVRERDVWKSIVADGALGANGMVGFGKVYSKEDIEAIRSYVSNEARVSL